MKSKFKKVIQEKLKKINILFCGIFLAILFQTVLTQGVSAAPATLLFNNTAVNVAIGADFDLIAQVDPLTNNPGINAVQMYITFDPSVLQINNITNITGAGYFSPVDGYPVFDNVAGTASIVVYSSTAKLVKTNVATLSFRAVSAVTDSPIAYTTESNAVINDGQGTKVINTRTPSLVTITGTDLIAPNITAFDVPTFYNNLIVPITTLTAADAVGVTAYLVNESATTPAVNDTGWGAKPTQYTFGTGGSKTLYAWAKDAAGNISTSLSDAVTIDTAIPTITSISSDKAAGSYKIGEIIDIDVTFSENVTSTGNVTVTLETGTVDRTCTFTISNSSTGTCNYTVQAGDTTSDLNATIAGTIADQANNVLTNFSPATTLAANEALVIDTTAPIVTLTSPANGSSISDTTPTLTFNSSEGVVVVKVDNVVVTKASGDSLDVLSEGSHVVSVEATDSAQNVTTRTNTFTIDVTAPDTTILNKPTNPSITSSANFSFTSEANVSFQCKMDSGNYSACVSPKLYSGLAQGDHVFTVRALDAAGNIDSTPASFAWNINLPPAVSTGSPWGKLKDGTRQTTISVATDENATCKYSYGSGSDFSSMNAFSTTGATSHSTVISGLSDGKSYGIFVRCQDVNGNISQSDYLISFKVDKDSKKDEKKKTKSRSISASKKSIVRGATLIQRGKKFSKNSFVLLYFSKYGGGYYAPQKIKTSSSGAFTVKYVVSKPKGAYNWYVVDIKTGKKSKTSTYKVK